ncbi:MAG: CBS domain-containing protein [Massilia sp.]
MQTIADIMTRDVVSVSPQDTLQTAAQMMRDSDIGSLAVVDGQRLAGMLTDRDITIRAVAGGLSLDTPVVEVMSEDVLHCYDDQSVEDVLNDMGDMQTRRLPVLDHAREALIGIVSLGDLAHVDTGLSGDILREVSSSTPPAPPMS